MNVKKLMRHIFAIFTAKSGFPLKGKQKIKK